MLGTVTFWNRCGEAVGPGACGLDGEKSGSVWQQSCCLEFYKLKTSLSCRRSVRRGGHARMLQQRSQQRRGSSQAAACGSLNRWRSARRRCTSGVRGARAHHAPNAVTHGTPRSMSHRGQAGLRGRTLPDRRRQSSPSISPEFLCPPHCALCVSEPDPYAMSAMQFLRMPQGQWGRPAMCGS